MLEVAIISIKCALRDEFPEFLEFFEARSWEPKKDEESEGEPSADETCENSEINVAGSDADGAEGTASVAESDTSDSNSEINDSVDKSDKKQVDCKESVTISADTFEEEHKISKESSTDEVK